MSDRESRRLDSEREEWLQNNAPRCADCGGRLDTTEEIDTHQTRHVQGDRFIKGEWYSQLQMDWTGETGEGEN